MATYDVIWRITIEPSEQEELDKTKEEILELVVKKAFEKLQSGKNDWIWEVLDHETSKVYDVDFESQGSPLINEIEK